ncbi:5'-nucleotidase [Corynebacterium endometrii]|uniref:5'-nucleotidase n=2 Tax=Corynebacterium endometrii TaxID=2488819 RepID=A0A4P7QGN5_9CORY|nr:5'-nucleotidase [Corynebacterium endometrii]
MKALLLDVDGTLIDSFPGVRDSLFMALDAVSWPHPAPDVLHRLPGPPLEDTLAEYGMDAALVTRTMEVYRAEYDARGWANARLFPGWLETLQAWKEQGYFLHTATSKGEAVAHRMLEHLGATRYLDSVGGADAAIGRRTKADVIAWVFEREGLDPARDEILMVGDRLHDTQGAAQFGVPTALVGWGHGSRKEWDAAAYFAPDMPTLRAVVDAHFNP